MKIKSKYTYLTIFIVLYLILLLHFVSLRISKKNYDRFLVDAIERSLPGTEVTFGESDITIGYTINFKVNNLEIRLRNRGKFSQKKVVKIGELVARVKTLDYLREKGNITFYSDSTELFFEKMDDQSNIRRMFNQPKGDFEISLFEKLLKGFNKDMSHFSFNIKLYNTKVTLLRERERFTQEFERVYFKNINHGPEVAYELQGDVDYDLIFNGEANNNIGRIFVVGTFNRDKLGENIFENHFYSEIFNFKLSSLKRNLDIIKVNAHSSYGASSGFSVEFDAQINNNSSLKGTARKKLNWDVNDISGKVRVDELVKVLGFNWHEKVSLKKQIVELSYSSEKGGIFTFNNNVDVANVCGLNGSYQFSGNVNSENMYLNFKNSASESDVSSITLNFKNGELKVRDDTWSFYDSLNCVVYLDKFFRENVSFPKMDVFLPPIPILESHKEFVVRDRALLRDDVQVGMVKILPSGLTGLEFKNSEIDPSFAPQLISLKNKDLKGLIILNEDTNEIVLRYDHASELNFSFSLIEGNQIGKGKMVGTNLTSDLVMGKDGWEIRKLKFTADKEDMSLSGLIPYGKNLTKESLQNIKVNKL